MQHLCYVKVPLLVAGMNARCRAFGLGYQVISEIFILAEASEHTELPPSTVK